MSGIAQLSKAFVRVRGRDAARFLNGLTTARLLPNVVKKKQHTISDAENRHLHLAAVIDDTRNWGLMHEDIYDPDQRIAVLRDGLYLMFLNSKGRVVNDCFMYADPYGASDDVGSYVLEVAPRYARSLALLLRIHKLSAQVAFDAPPLHLYYCYNDHAGFDDFLEEIQAQYALADDPAGALDAAQAFLRSGAVVLPQHAASVVGLAYDNRIPNFGIKIVTSAPVAPQSLLSDAFLRAFPTETVPELRVTQRRFVNGLFETGDAPAGVLLLPFEANLDYVNGLSLDKGCYVGQELTIRTYNGGVIRKRVVPVTFSHNVSALLGAASVADLDVAKLGAEPEPAAAASPFGSLGKVARRGKVARLLAADGTLGFMLAAVADVERGTRYETAVGGEAVAIEAHIPSWWP